MDINERESVKEQKPNAFLGHLMVFIDEHEDKIVSGIIYFVISSVALHIIWYIQVALSILDIAPPYKCRTDLYWDLVPYYPMFRFVRFIIQYVIHQFAIIPAC